MNTNINATAAEQEAIAQADAYASNAGLPSYTELARSLWMLTSGSLNNVKHGEHAPADEAMRNSAVMFVGLLFNPEADGSHD